MPPGVGQSLIRAKTRESIVPRVGPLVCSEKVRASADKSSDFHGKINSFLVSQRKKAIHKLFGREHHAVFDAIFFALQILKMRLFIHDIEGSEKVAAKLQLLLKRYIKKIREYIRIQSEKMDGDDNQTDDPLVSKICSDMGTNCVSRRREIAQLIREENRKTIAELHDGILQSLVGALIGLQFCERLYDKNRKRVVKEINEIELIVWDLSEKSRKFYTRETLFSPLNLRLVPALKKYVRSLRSIIGIDISLACIGEEGKLSFPIRTNLLYIAREALGNAIYHANCSKVKVEIRIKKDAAILNVTDDGIGFAPREALSSARTLGHHGLIGMAERAELLNGKLVIDANRGKGSTISVQIPIS